MNSPYVKFLWVDLDGVLHFKNYLLFYSLSWKHCTCSTLNIHYPALRALFKLVFVSLPVAFVHVCVVHIIVNLNTQEAHFHPLQL